MSLPIAFEDEERAESSELDRRNEIQTNIKLVHAGRRIDSRAAKL